KLSQGVPIGRVLSDIRESAPSGEMERVHLIEKKDLNNIVRDFSIGYTTKRHKNDAVSVQLWVKAMQLLENNPVLFYKNTYTCLLSLFFQCFKCSCLDNVINYNICKHIHACCLYFFNNVLAHAPSVFKSESNNVTNNFISAVPSSSNSNRDLLNSKLEVLIGLNNRFNLGEADENIISKYLDKAIDIYNTNGQVNFEVKESVTTTQKLEPQVRMFSAKRKRRSQKDIQQPLAHETKSIKLALADSEAKVPNISTDFNFEHSYSKL
uniref:Uncharacterized protein LOC114341632 n=1 Tax=Diabrotica virgifera virgifera TaxID=50390 RepID=A0A6P7GF69_DIAVI